jgi:hypothetical protein
MCYGTGNNVHLNTTGEKCEKCGGSGLCPSCGGTGWADTEWDPDPLEAL